MIPAPLVSKLFGYREKGQAVKFEKPKTVIVLDWDLASDRILLQDENGLIEVHKLTEVVLESSLRVGSQLTPPGLRIAQ
jgi:hypothetical protein